MDLVQIRRLVIVAMFSDDELLARFALKGGNALNLVYRLGSRVSADIDLSLQDDFQDLDDARRRIFRSIENRFAEVGLTVFDLKMMPRPDGVQHDARLAGYEITFKLIESDRYKALDDHTRRQRESIVVGPFEQRIFRVQISKYEYCVGKRETELDDYTISVYTPEMLAIEKLRAICQQMPDYPLRGHQIPRARDFYDIHSVITGLSIDLGSLTNVQLARDIFAAKDVPLTLIPRIPEYRDFHRQDWPAVEVAVSGKVSDFDFYFDFVVDQTKLLKALWEEHTP